MPITTIMETIKLGSKGDAVKKLQQALNLTVDGDKKKKTDKAVREFQAKNKLTVDGIVGNNTWKALGITDTVTMPKCIDSSVIYKPLPVHVTRYSRTPKYLAIHFTAGSNSKPGRALNTYNTFINRQASADFVVDDKDVVQFNPDIKNYYCWAVGDTKQSSRGGAKFNSKASNRNTISIEICSTCNPATSTAVSKPNHDGWSFTDAVFNNAVWLAKLIMKKYNIPIENVVRHYDITGKLCPGILGWNDEAIYDQNTGKKIVGKWNNSEEWLKFKQRLV